VIAQLAIAIYFIGVNLVACGFIYTKQKGQHDAPSTLVLCAIVCMLWFIMVPLLMWEAQQARIRPGRREM
jgi:hypothetical protein